MQELPIDSVRQELEEVWAKTNQFILQAPTGSGKSTRVPRMLFEYKAWASDEVIIVLQPRRMAARLLAKRVADEMSETCGERVGYQVRFERKRSPSTRILYITEGLLLRWLGKCLNTNKKEIVIDGVGKIGAILFDEFHERHLEGDMGLSLSLLAQKRGWRGKVGVFSATLDISFLKALLPNAGIVQSEGRQFPVKIEYKGFPIRDPLWKRVAIGVTTAIRNGAQSDILVFLPGKYEIQKTISLLNELPDIKGWKVWPLHGDLESERQDAVVRAGEEKRIIVSTNIAETSLTLPGVRTVIDTGMAKLPGYDSRRSVNTLLTLPISQASADQRAGRAGRVSSGYCLRLWNEREHEYREKFTPSEITRVDLSQVQLQLFAVVKEYDQLSDSAFPWVEAPPESAWEVAKKLLERLGAIELNQISSLGRRMVNFPLHPRLSRLFIAGNKYNCMIPMISAIALWECRDLELPLNDKLKIAQREEWYAPAVGVSDTLKNVLIFQHVLKQENYWKFCREWGISMKEMHKAVNIYKQLINNALSEGLLREEESAFRMESFCKALLTGFADHVAKRLDRGSLRSEMVGSRRGDLSRSSTVRNAELFVSLDVEEREGRNGTTLNLGDSTAIDIEWLRELFPEAFSDTSEPYLNRKLRKVESVRRKVFYDLVVVEEFDDAVPEGAEELLAKGIIEENWTLKHWNTEAENWIRRLNVLARYAPELEIQPIGEQDRELLIAQLCEGATRYKDVKDRDVMNVLKTWVPESLHDILEQWAPVRFKLPTGSSIKLRYETDGTVVLPARIQQLYDVPGNCLQICNGNCSLKVELLAPNGRPVQITHDLDSFWKGQYQQIKKELYGRYPKHEWR